jgi:hypothetical protein
MDASSAPRERLSRDHYAAYVLLLFEFLEACPAEMPLAERVAQLIAGPLADKNILLSFYSRERLMSTAARMAWLEPDIKPLRVTTANA